MNVHLFRKIYSLLKTLLPLIVTWIIASFMSDSVLENIINFFGLLVAGLLGRWTVMKYYEKKEESLRGS